MERNASTASAGMVARTTRTSVLTAAHGSTSAWEGARSWRHYAAGAVARMIFTAALEMSFEIVPYARLGTLPRITNGLRLRGCGRLAVRRQWCAIRWTAMRENWIREVE